MVRMSRGAEQRRYKEQGNRFLLCVVHCGTLPQQERALALLVWLHSLVSCSTPGWFFSDHLAHWFSSSAVQEILKHAIPNTHHPFPSLPPKRYLDDILSTSVANMPALFLSPPSFFLSSSFLPPFLSFFLSLLLAFILYALSTQYPSIFYTV